MSDPVILDTTTKTSKSVNNVVDKTMSDAIWSIILEEISHQYKNMEYLTSLSNDMKIQIKDVDKNLIISFVLSNNRDKFFQCIASYDLIKHVSIEGQWIMWDAISQRTTLWIKLGESKIPSACRTSVWSFDNNFERKQTKPLETINETNTELNENNEKLQVRKVQLFSNRIQAFLKKTTNDETNTNRLTDVEKKQEKKKIFVFQKGLFGEKKKCICNETSSSFVVQLKPPAQHRSLKFASKQISKRCSNNTSYNHTYDATGDIFICV